MGFKLAPAVQHLYHNHHIRRNQIRSAGPCCCDHEDRSASIDLLLDVLGIEAPERM
jgi:hypothetical protein